MYIQNSVARALLITASIFAVSTTIFADNEDLRAISAAKITLSEAIARAEAAQEGIAFEANIDDDSFRPEYEVSIALDGRVFDVRINAETGEVIGVREDIDD